MQIITLTTDFGTSDVFAGVMKGVILSIVPEARLVDLTHDVPPQDLLAGALALEAAAPFFPIGTIHLGVVDPGVGTQRRAVAVKTDSAFFVGPDNGLFTLALGNQAGFRAVSIENREFGLPEISRTFHGRDIFAPAAAYLARGARLEALGPAAGDLVRLEIPAPVATAEGLRGCVLAADRFGNLVTNLTDVTVNEKMGHTAMGSFEALVGGRSMGVVQRTYADVEVGSPVIYMGSAGRLEIGIREGSAVRKLKAGRGTEVELRLVRG